MKSDAWASYQAALPPEARAGGEPDFDDPPPRRDRKGRPKLYRMGPGPIGVECWQPVYREDSITVHDPATETHSTVLMGGDQDAPSVRWFDGPHLIAWAAADRFARLMARRLGPGKVFLVEFDGTIIRRRFDGC